jgi:hypothetical protein
MRLDFLRPAGGVADLLHCVALGDAHRDGVEALGQREPVWLVIDDEHPGGALQVAAVRREQANRAGPEHDDRVPWPHAGQFGAAPAASMSR